MNNKDNVASVARSTVCQMVLYLISMVIIWFGCGLVDPAIRPLVFGLLGIVALECADIRAAIRNNK